MTTWDRLRRMWQIFKGCRHGHQWFPPYAYYWQPEFLPVRQTCLRCTATRALLPTADCLGGGGHPLSEHYDEEGRQVWLAGCPGPQ